MRPILSLKTLFRAPFKTLITFFIITAASFALFSRVTDYAVTQREMARATSYYRGVFAIDKGVRRTGDFLGSQIRHYMNKPNDTSPPPVPPIPLTQEQMDAFSSLNGVSGTDTRYMTAGIIEDLKRVVRHDSYVVKYDFTTRFVITGTYTGYTATTTGRRQITSWNLINLSDWELLAGNLPETGGDKISVIAQASDGVSMAWSENMHLFYILWHNPFGRSFIDTLNAGDKVLIIGVWRSEKYEETGELALYIGDNDTIDYCDSFWLLNDKPENFLETEEFAKVREIIDITNQDCKTFDIVYTSALLSIPRFNEEKMVIQEGRALVGTDINACVLNYSLMKLNGLEIGDKITVGLCDKLLPQHSGMGATAYIPLRFSKPSETAELEIVGAYIDTDTQAMRDADEWWGYSPNTIFVPSSLLPVDVPNGHEINPTEFSVIVDNALEIEDFYNEAKALARDMGITPRFSDKGWLAVSDSINANQTMSFMTTALFIGVSAVAVLLTVYIYIRSNRKNYAIMRALGTPSRLARKTLLLPFAVLSVLALLVGGGAGVFAARNAVLSITQNLAAAEHYIPDTSLPVNVILICLLSESFFLVLFFAFFMGGLAKTPPLALLQGGNGRGRNKGKNGIRFKRGINSINSAHDQTALSLEFTPSFSIIPSVPKQRDYSAKKHVTRYISRNMRRNVPKTLLAALLSLMLVGAMGLLGLTRLSYRELFDKTEVKGAMLNYPSNAVTEAQKSGLVENFYYSGGFFVITNGIPNDEGGEPLSLTNDIDRYIQSKSEEKYLVRYGEGYDESLFNGNEAVCLIGSKLASQYGLMVGDSITMLSWEQAQVLKMIIENADDFYAEAGKASLEFYIAGIVTSNDNNIAKAIYAPISETVSEISSYGEEPFPVELCEFTLADNENPYVLTNYLDELKNTDTHYPDAIVYNMDTSEIDSIKRVRDMLEQLFPFAAAAMILIGMAAPVLIIIQSAKEAAVLRILGTTKLRARCMLALEQIALCILGVLTAGAGLVIYDAEYFIKSADTLVLCGALYLFGCICSAAVTAMLISKNKALELLQVAE